MKKDAVSEGAFVVKVNLVVAWFGWRSCVEHKQVGNTAKYL